MLVAANGIVFLQFSMCNGRPIEQTACQKIFDSGAVLRQHSRRQRKIQPCHACQGGNRRMLVLTQDKCQS